MKKVIDRKVYDTEKSELICEWDNGYYGSDFKQCSEDLYLTRKGRWFIHGSGGPMSKYAEHNGQGYCGSSDIVPMSKDEVVEWLENHNFVGTLEAYFPKVIAEA